jgi:hypothetical protein
MHRHFMRKDKVATLRKEIEILAQTHGMSFIMLPCSIIGY